MIWPWGALLTLEKRVRALEYERAVLLAALNHATQDERRPFSGGWRRYCRYCGALQPAHHEPDCPVTIYAERKEEQ